MLYRGPTPCTVHVVRHTWQDTDRHSEFVVL